MESRHVRKIRNEKQDYPAAANPRIEVAAGAVRLGGQEKLTPRIDDRHEEPKYNNRGTIPGPPPRSTVPQRHPVGTKARLALQLIRYTTGRREDISPAARAGSDLHHDGDR